MHSLGLRGSFLKLFDCSDGIAFAKNNYGSLYSSGSWPAAVMKLCMRSRMCLLCRACIQCVGCPARYCADAWHITLSGPVVQLR
jgi:hypothetical protein